MRSVTTFYSSTRVASLRVTHAGLRVRRLCAERALRRAQRSRAAARRRLQDVRARAVARCVGPRGRPLGIARGFLPLIRH